MHHTGLQCAHSQILRKNSAGASAAWYHLAGYRNRRIRSITVRPFRFCNSDRVLYWRKIILRAYYYRQCLRRPPKHYCRGYRVPNRIGFAGSTALPFEDAHPVQPVILQASRYQGIRVNAGGCRNDMPTRASMFETSANKKAYEF